MADTFKFELVTPERMLVSEDAVQVVVPGAEGDFTALPGHAPVISALRPGILEATLAGDRKSARVFVKGGFAEVDADRLTVLAQRALDIGSLDAATVSAELQIAEADLAAAGDDVSKRYAFAAVEQLRALQR
jgi:F-type H+-transporting ATPase subunit epsilon